MKKYETKFDLSSYKQHRLSKFRLVPKILVASLMVALSVTSSAAQASPITENNIISLVNLERGRYGRKPLRVNRDLDNAALLKSKDMVNRDYFDHYAFGLSPWDFLTSFDYDYSYAGENLAMDFRTSEGVVKAWMNSPSHRDNILNSDYEDAGIGIVKGEFTEDGQTRETTVVTNMFGRKKSTASRIVSKIMSSLVF